MRKQGGLGFVVHVIQQWYVQRYHDGNPFGQGGLTIPSPQRAVIGSPLSRGPSLPRRTHEHRGLSWQPDSSVIRDFRPMHSGCFHPIISIPENLNMKAYEQLGINGALV